MSNYGLLYRVILGVRQKPLKALVSAFIAYAAIWTVLEPLISIVSPAQKYFSGEVKFFILLLASILIGLYKSAVSKELSIQYGNSVIKIVFGDLFSSSGIKAIPVSRYFFEVEVVPTSLQNKIIQFLCRARRVQRVLAFTRRAYLLLFSTNSINKSIETLLKGKKSITL